jgi:hypothetical protein
VELISDSVKNRICHQNNKMPVGKKIFYLCLLVFVIFFSFRCSTDPIVIDPQNVGDYYVRSVISPNIAQQGVIIGKTVPENMPTDIHDAHVKFYSDDGTFDLQEFKPGQYLDIYYKMKICPGTKYLLSVTLPNGRQLLSGTTVPGSFNIMPHADTLEYEIQGKGFFAEYQAPSISWKQSKKALSYKLSIYKLNRTFIGRVETFDTTITLPYIYPIQTMQYDATLPSIKIEALLEIMAQDSSYLPFPGGRFDSDLDEKIKIYSEQLHLSSGYNDNIIGAQGYFASYSAVYDTVFIKVKRQNQ